jgi:hypothetical protein
MKRLVAKSFLARRGSASVSFVCGGPPARACAERARFPSPDQLCYGALGHSLESPDLP